MPPEKNGPYWSFWKVVFAGWLIRYPRVFFNALCWVVIVCAFLGFYSYDKLSDVLTEPDRLDTQLDREYNDNTREVF